MQAAGGRGRSFCPGRDTHGRLCFLDHGTHDGGAGLGGQGRVQPGLGPSVRGWVQRAISRVKKSPRLFRINLYSHGEVGFCANRPTTR